MGGQAKHLMRHLPALATVALAAWLAARSAAGASSPVASAILLALVGAGVFFAAWRLVQNRAVAAAAGVLALVHPTLASLAASSDADWTRRPEDSREMDFCIIWLDCDTLTWAASEAVLGASDGPKQP